MTTLKEIVNIRLGELGLGPIEAATQAGLERTFIRDIVEDRKKSVRSDKMADLARALHLDAAALGRNQIVRVAPESGGAEPLISTFDPDALDQDGTEGESYSREHWRPRIVGAIPELDGKLGAGEGIVGDLMTLPLENGSVSGHRIIAEWLIPSPFLRNEIKASPLHTVVMEVIGDSMQPTYQPGDRVLIDLSQNSFQSDTVYAISDGYAEPQIKRLQRIPFSDPPLVKIISDNPALETFTVELSRLTIVGRICGHIARK